MKLVTLTNVGKPLLRTNSAVVLPHLCLRDDAAGIALLPIMPHRQFNGVAECFCFADPSLLGLRGKAGHFIWLYSLLPREYDTRLSLQHL